jgi:hypothetical protein
MLSWLYAYAFVALRLCFRGFMPMLSWLHAYAFAALRLCSCGFTPMPMWLYAYATRFDTCRPRLTSATPE